MDDTSDLPSFPWFEISPMQVILEWHIEHSLASDWYFHFSLLLHISQLNCPWFWRSNLFRHSLYAYISSPLLSEIHLVLCVCFCEGSSTIQVLSLRKDFPGRFKPEDSLPCSFWRETVQMSTMSLRCQSENVLASPYQEPTSSELNTKLFRLMNWPIFLLSQPF
jgi:hypothetical protein